MRVVVTGAAGFLGRHIARASASCGYHVTGLGHGDRENALSSWGVQNWRAGEVTIDALEAITDRVDIVFHCAGGSSVAQSLENPIRDFRRTVDSTLAVLEFVRKRAGETKLVLTSSAGVYGKAASIPIRVSAPLQPVSPYGFHKKIAEDLCRSYSVSFGISTAIVRLFSVYGQELRKQLLWDACRRLSGGDNLFSGTGAETRDWLHVQDAAELLLVAARHASPDCPIANGGTGEAVSVRAIVETIGRCLPGAPVPQFSGEKRGGDPDHYQADLTEAKGWGWMPRRDWQTGIAEYVAWYQGIEK